MFAALLPAKAQVIEHVDPPSWFTGMKEESLQLMVYGKEIGSYTVTTDYPGIEVKTMVRTDNPNYLFVYLNISDKAIPGTASLTFTRGKQKITHNYPLLSRPAGPARGFNSSDVIYLLMPDRFANGDTSNDNVEGMTEQLDRANPGGRHGGDLKGISDHLDYLHDLGVTGIWLNPFLENNQKAYSYHGYSTTDFYKSDPRYGSNEEFKNLNKKSAYLTKKAVRKALKDTNKYIRFSGSKETEIELLVYFCQQMRKHGNRLSYSRVLANLYMNLVKRIQKTLSTLPHDLQLVYADAPTNL